MRLAWAKKHELRTLDWWKSVLWSESKFEIFGSNRRVFVISRVGERMISACVVPTEKHGGVMVRGCFAGDTVCDIFRIKGTLNQHHYHRIMQRNTIPSGLHLVGISFVFQQENYPKQAASRLCKSYLTKKESDGVLHQMTWPPQSPHLNPIEMVWDELDCRVKEKQPTSARYMLALLQYCWKSIPGEAKSAQSCNQRKGWLLYRISTIRYILICLTLFWLPHYSMCY